ncbi:hypothetical protein O181_095461 [Austropuccinia psidii MF-1]|uniref:Uncharacterized protein n=1 Tax=Austropuccinia psidii MF-1 TaxID=1389203 RepID=A0A9Q3J555_9BASI|nr:hypothetical protein [Austropuccinia psidii MF-1]
MSAQRIGTNGGFQWLASTFDTVIKSPEAEKTSIPVLRPDSFPKRNSGNIPFSVQELVYASKAAGVGTSFKSFNRHTELLSSCEEFHCPRKDSRPSEGLDTHFLQRKSPKDKSLFEKPMNFFRGQEERVVPKEEQPIGNP